MNKKNVWIVGLATVICVGCNAGMAPEPMSESDLKAGIEKMPPKDQIAYINSSPMSAEMKAQRIKEIEDKTGYKAPTSNAPKTGG